MKTNKRYFYKTIETPRINSFKETEITARIRSGNKCFYHLTKSLGSRSPSTDVKIQLYVTTLRPVITRNRTRREEGITASRSVITYETE